MYRKTNNLIFKNKTEFDHVRLYISRVLTNKLLYCQMQIICEIQKVKQLAFHATLVQGSGRLVTATFFYHTRIKAYVNLDV